nr:E3 ubiquitin-protein ligase SDIR1-like [Ipomoea batatas]
MENALMDHNHELKATFSVWSPCASASATAAMATPVKLHFVFNTIHRYVVLHDESQIATRSQPTMAYRDRGRFNSTTKLDRSTLLSHHSSPAFHRIVLSKLWEYWGHARHVWLQLGGVESLVPDIVQSIRRLVLANPTNRVRVHVDFFTYHVLDGFLLVGNYGMKPACKSATMEMLKKVDKNHLLDDDERCTVCLEELGREDEEVLCMPCLHRFHGECILKWLDNSHYCPICRYQMPIQ